MQMAKVAGRQLMKVPCARVSLPAISMRGLSPGDARIDARLMRGLMRG